MSVSESILVFSATPGAGQVPSDAPPGALDTARLAAIVDSSDDAIVSKNLDGVIQSWNAAAQRLFGYSAEEVIGRHVSLLIPPDRSDEEDQILSRLRAGERVYHFDTVRMRKDGTPIHVSVTISPLRDDTGRIVGASKIARDISERKRLEDQIYGLLKRLKEADRAKDDFLATLAHELRGPLSPLRTLVDIIKRADSPDPIVHQVRETMERQVGLMVRLVDDLFDLSRISRNTLELRAERVELAAVLRQAVEVARPLCEAARHELVVELPPEPVHLHADAARLVQVFGNLLNNACRYTDPGGRVAISTQLEQDVVAIRFRDSGIGIPSDKLGRVFEMFTQVRSPEERSRGGLGIGLALVKRLVEFHGGMVTVTSDGPGRGSEFTVYLPRLTGAADMPSATAPALVPAVVGRRILVVDDNADSADSLATLLRIAGNEAMTANDGYAALDAVRSWRPELVLLDISLPKLDGHEVARRIRAEPWGADVLLIALTGWGQEEDRRRSRAAGFDEHVVKPIDYEELMQLLTKLLRSYSR